MSQGIKTVPTSQVRIFQPEEHEKGRLVVWWYGRIEKNHRATDVPLVVVFLKKIDDKGRPFGRYLERRIALSELGPIPLGSVLDGGQRVSLSYLDEADFDIDFTHGNWRFVSPAERRESTQPSPINMDDYPLPYARERGWLLDFPLGSGKNLLIPSLVFFIRAYGRSAEVKRVLATYPWPEAQRRLYTPEQPSEPGRWAIKLTKRMRNGDSVLLAHLHYDPYAQKSGREIYGQIESAFSKVEPHAYIQVRPWFEGEAKVKVKGIWINGGRTFLALRVMSVSDPQGVPIERDRDNTNKVDAPAAEGDEGKAWVGAPRRSPRQLPEIIDLTDADAPDDDSVIIEIEEDEFVVLGTPRTVIDVRRPQAKSSSGKPGDGGNPDTFSTGEAYGSGKGVGYASIHAPQVMESHGVLRDMWNAMLYAKRTHPDLIQKVEWFTFDRGFCSDAEPQIIPLKPFYDDDEVDTGVRNWLYLDVQERVSRGVLVARLSIGQKHVHILEIQRRARKGGESEESFQGLVFKLEHDGQFDSCLRTMLSSIRSEKGVMKKLGGKCPGESRSFNHLPAREGKPAGEPALWNALSKVGIKP